MTTPNLSNPLEPEDDAARQGWSFLLNALPQTALAIGLNFIAERSQKAPSMRNTHFPMAGSWIFPSIRFTETRRS